MPVTTAFWCERANVGSQIWNRLLIRCDENGMITERLQDVDPPPDAYRLPGVVFPGFANGHSHAFHRMLRGRTHNYFDSFWNWRDAMYQVAAELNPDSYYQLARLVYAEMVQAGYTCVGEFHYLHHQPDGTPYADPNAMGTALIEAARDAGIRITLLDTLYLAGGLDGNGYQPLSELQLAFGDGSVSAWFDRVAKLENDYARIAAALHSVRAVPADVLPDIAKHTQGRPVHVHLSEQPAENEACQAFHGCSPSELLSRNGILTDNLTAVHATHLSEVDIGLLRNAAATACFCPTTEADLADGIGPASAFTRLSIGSDQHAVVDPFAELRGLEYGERLRTGKRGQFKPGDLVHIGTSSGYASLGWRPGRIFANGPCDLVAVRTDTPRTAGSAPDQLVMAASASDVDTVVVGGKIVVRDGHHETIDVGPELAAMVDGWWDR